MLLHHDPARPIGAWHDLRETASGLEVKGQLALSTRDGAEARALLELGALTGLSIGFNSARRIPPADGARQIVDLDLHETSLVALPSNPRARVTAIKRHPGPLTARAIEQALADSGLGLSGRERKAVASAAIRTLAERTPEADSALDRLAAEMAAARAAIAPYLKGTY
jgi:hypothetical protein